MKRFSVSDAVRKSIFAGPNGNDIQLTGWISTATLSELQEYISQLPLPSFSRWVKFADETIRKRLSEAGDASRN